MCCLIQNHQTEENIAFFEFCNTHTHIHTHTHIYNMQRLIKNKKDKHVSKVITSAKNPFITIFTILQVSKYNYYLCHTNTHSNKPIYKGHKYSNNILSD